MITHLRTEWQSPAEPVTGPPMRWSDIDAVAIHYTAAINLIDGDPGEDWDKIPAFLRAVQRDYLTHRPQASGATGYSVGYNWAVDQRGDAWELRGWDIKCAANKGHNDHCVAILMLVDGDDGATPAAVETVQQLVRNAQAWAKRTLAITAHGWLSPGTEARPSTACCGAGLKAQVKAGVFTPTDPPLPQPPPTEEDDMTYQLVYTGPQDGHAARPELLLVQGIAVGLTSLESAIAMAAVFKPTRVEITDPAQYDEFVAQARI